MNNENEVEQAVRQHAVVTHDEVEVTSPNSLTAPPQGAGAVGQRDPGQPAAREVPIEPAKSPAANPITEYKQPMSRLPERITAREIQDDRSNPDGRISEVQR
jgi:hypothetical protein